MPAKKAPPRREVAKSSTSELDLIRSLAGILNDTGLTEIELDQRGVRVRVSKTVTTVANVTTQSQMQHLQSASVAPVSAPLITKPPESDMSTAVKSPMVGTIYMAPSPGSPNFIEIGAQVKQGQTLLIIEAMKTMNQISSPSSGTVTKIFVSNGDPVEYGEPLVMIE
jgi:acetyl-CoA carboxylase biotin carboxyl carrier protein